MSFNIKLLKKLLHKEIVTSKATKVVIKKKINVEDNDIDLMSSYEAICSILDTLTWISAEIESIEITGKEL